MPQYRYTSKGLRLPNKLGDEFDDEFNIRKIDELLGGPGGTVQNGLLVTNVSGQDFAQLPLTAGQLKANIGHRTGLSASLATLSGIDGEISVATDEPALYLHNGVANGARKLRSIAGAAAGSVLLTNSTTSSIAATAPNAVVIGSNAVAETPGVVVEGSQAAGVYRTTYKFQTNTTNAITRYMQAASPTAAPTVAENILRLKLGMHLLDINLLCCDLGQGKIVSFKGRGRVVVSDYATDLITNDVTFAAAEGTQGDTAMAALTPTFVYHKVDAGGSGLEGFAVKITGVAGRSFVWVMCADVTSYAP